MRFAAPAAFAWLTLAGIVIVLHRLRPRPQQVVVPSLLLWHRVDTALAAQRRWRRLLQTLLLLAHLMLVALLTMALARPMYVTPARAPHTVHIVDRSASMMAADVSPNRFIDATRQLAQHIRERPGPVTVIAAGATAPILYHGNDPNDALAALNTVTPQAAAPNWAAAAAAVQGLTPAPDIITVWTDGVTDPDAFAALTAVAAPRLNVHFVGNAAADNVAITAFHLQRKGADLQAYELLLEVENFGAASVTVPLRIDVDDVTLRTDTMLLAPGEAQRLVTDIPRLTGRIVQAHISPAADDEAAAPVDYLSLDNSAAIVTRLPELSHIALVGGGHDALQQGLRIFPHVRLQHKLLLGPDDLYHLAIHHGTLPTPEAGHHWVIPLPTPDTIARRPAAVTWADPLHPITRHIDWEQLRIDHAQPIAPPPGAQVLVDSDAGPVLTLESRPQGSILRLGFALEQSDLVRRIAFPVLLSNVLQYVHPAGWDPVQHPVAAGLAYQIAAANEAVPRRVVDPHGAQLPWHETESGLWVTPHVSGVHYVVYDDQAHPFVVQLPPKHMANLQRRLASTNPPAQVASSTVTPMERPLEPWLVAAALTLLFTETWLYANRGHRPGRGAPRPGDAA